MMKRASILGRSSAAAVLLALWTLTPVAACGPRDSAEPRHRRRASAPDPLPSCRARIRCYRSIVRHQTAAVKRLTEAMFDMYKVEANDRNAEVRTRATASLEAARAREIELADQLRSLTAPGPAPTAAACEACRKRLLRAMDLLKNRYLVVVKQTLGSLGRQARSPDEDMQRLAQIAIDDLRKDLRKDKRRLTGLKECKPFTRRK